MAKVLDYDVQVLVAMAEQQMKMEELILSEDEGISELACNEEKYNKLFFHTLRFLHISKNLSNKTKKETNLFIEDRKTKLIIDELSSCYPTISKEEVVRYAFDLSSEECQLNLKERHDYIMEKLYSK